MTPDSDIQDTVRGFVASELLVKQDVAVDDDLLLSGLVDSIGVMRIVAFLEGRFQIKIPPEHVTIENMVSIKAMTRYLVEQHAI